MIDFQCVPVRWNTKTCWCVDIFRGIEVDGTRQPVASGLEVNTMCNADIKDAPVRNNLYFV